MKYECAYLHLGDTESQNIDAIVLWTTGGSYRWPHTDMAGSAHLYTLQKHRNRSLERGSRSNQLEIFLRFGK